MSIPVSRNGSQETQAIVGLRFLAETLGLPVLSGVEIQPQNPMLKQTLDEVWELLLQVDKLMKTAEEKLNEAGNQFLVDEDVFLLHKQVQELCDNLFWNGTKLPRLRLR